MSTIKFIRYLIRAIGISILAVIISRLDFYQTLNVLKDINWAIVFVAITLNVPMLFIKTLRWHTLILAYDAKYGLKNAFLAYLSGTFIGLFTPGRLGEFIKIYYLHKSGTLTINKSISSVLVDRLFDLYLLIVFGSIGLCGILFASLLIQSLILVLILIIFLIPIAVIINESLFKSLHRLIEYIIFVDEWRKKAKSLIFDFRTALLNLRLNYLIICTILTLGAYSIIFSQAYILSKAIGIQIGWIGAAFTVSIGNLVALLPFSIAGIGTREAAAISFLNTKGIDNEASLAFMASLFITFYIGGGAIGAIAWLIKPLPTTVFKSKLPSEEKC